ncbi:MAG TPA: MFS transporter, partial [Pyrinomonadaceae bacterium]|nr:MFS transporter [Pyrinomonadaceae bacterium]
MNEIAENLDTFEEPKSKSEISPPEESAATFTGAVIEAASEINERIGRRRWVICGLLFFAATVNYVDRQVIGILKPTLSQQFGWTEIDYGWIVFSFQTAYAVGLFFAGNLMDRIGTRKGFSGSITVWSLAAMAHAWAVPIGVGAVAMLAWLSGLLGYASWGAALSASVVGFIVVRFLLGLGESGNFPASIKTVAEWFPKKERALATGIFNAGTNVGALATPLLVPVIVQTWGWYEAFIFTGLIGFLWLLFWLIFYRRPEETKGLSKRELAYIQSDPPDPTTKIPWKRLFPYRQTWAFSIGKFMTDPIWWVYLFWLPDFFSKRGLDLKSFGVPLAVI